MGFTKLANEVHLAKASKYLSSKEFEAAIGVFKVSFLQPRDMWLLRAGPCGTGDLV